ncbi:ANTAR domain-containing response regulator [Youxingia wuxianensis]|uniref:ANTAR domain-containing protein n=1 Tax=Youxingia wuxianensis TaxID=2763678 RepID=A0A926IHN7_9FIRM|nr:ANTAR domain-containing protein [Youxingia wuxianensis]MBC8585481.1 ANTAR domain-containing protein [Youxingia wuxianensis]
MDSVLIASSSQKGGELLAGLLKAAGYTPKYTLAFSGSEARRALVDNDFDLVIINTPLSDEFGNELSTCASDTSGVILIVKNEIADEVSSRVENYGVLVVAKPVGRAVFFQAVKLLNAAHQRLQGLKNENERLQSKIEEIRLVDRAKCALIQYLDMTEPQAHRYIEKQAMDMRTTKREIALGILSNYEN